MLGYQHFVSVGLVLVLEGLDDFHHLLLIEDVFLAFLDGVLLVDQSLFKSYFLDLCAIHYFFNAAGGNESVDIYIPFLANSASSVYCL